MTTKAASGRPLADAEPVRPLGTISMPVPSGGTINARELLKRRDGEIVLATLIGQSARQIGPGVRYSEANDIALALLGNAENGVPDVMLKLALAVAAAWCESPHLRRECVHEVAA